MKADWTLEIPPQWKTDEWDSASIQPLLEVPKADALAVQAMLRDGTNILGLIWPGGQQLLRIGPATAWGLQEHRDGNWPVAERDTLRRVWRRLVAIMVEAARDADDDMVRMGRAPMRARRARQ